MNETISTTKLKLVALSIILLGAGIFGGYYFTNQHYEQKENNESSKNQENLICEARIQKGHTGDVKSEYFIFENSAKQEDCEKFIEYKNIPEDTETFWLGF